jgi:hypothetical protein
MDLEDLQNGTERTIKTRTYKSQTVVYVCWKEMGCVSSVLLGRKIG